MLIQGYAPLVGGAERQVGALAPLLQESGIEVNIITKRYRGLAAFEVIDGIPVHRLPIPGPKAFASMSYTLSALPLLRRLRPHVIHAHELFSPATTAVAAKRLTGSAVVATPHRSGTLGDVYRLGHKRFGSRRLARIRRTVDAFITISREIDQELVDIGVPDGRRHFVPNGVDVRRFQPVTAGERQRLRASLGLPEGTITIYVGRLAPEKRIEHLLSLWPDVRSIHPDATLLILGSGVSEPRLRQAAGPGVLFGGNIDDVAPWLQAANLFVLPSSAEGLSVALLEAMATGLPVVATAVGGAPDVIDHHVNGWLVPPDDVPALRQAVITLLDDGPRRSQLGGYARERIVADYALSVVVARTCAVYRQLAGEIAGSAGVVESHR